MKEEDTGTVRGNAAPSGERDRVREQREARERLAAQQQTSPDLERIASLLSTIAENTSQKNQGHLPSTSQSVANQGVPTKRLSGMEALSLLSQGRAAATNPVNSGSASRPASNNALSSLYQNSSSASRPAPQGVGIGRLSQAQKDLLALAENSPAGTFIQAKREYGYSTEAAREQLTNTDLRVGTIIPAILINGINSELEGHIKINF